MQVYNNRYRNYKHIDIIIVSCLVKRLISLDRYYELSNFYKYLNIIYKNDIKHSNLK